MPGQHFDVLIVGGGVIGSSTAFFLSNEANRTHLRVGVVEPDPTYSRSSTALSVGGVRQQFSTPENILLSRYTTEFLATAGETLAVAGEPPELGFVEAGYLFLASSAGKKILETNAALQRSLGVDVALLDSQQLADRFPWMEVSDLAAGSLGLRGEGWLDPYSLLQAFRKKAIFNGAEYLPNRVTGVEVESGLVTGVSLGTGESIAVGAVVNAAGPMAESVALMAGIPGLPVKPRKRIVYRVHCRTQIQGAPLTIDPSGVYFRPEGRDFLCGTSPPTHQDPDTMDLEMEFGLFEEIVWPTLAKRVPAFEALKLSSSWAGHYAVNTIDQNAIVGPHPEIRNFFLANGFSGHGLQQAPGIGRAVSEFIRFGEFRTLNLSRFGFHRFAEGQLIREVNVV